MKSGDRVKATIYSATLEGTVIRHTSSIVWVKWDGKAGLSWHHLQSLKLAKTVK